MNREIVRKVRQLYCIGKLSSLQIAEKLGIAKRTVLRALISAGVKRRSLRQAFSISQTHGRNVRNRGAASLGWKGGLRHSQGYIQVFKPDHPAAHKSGYVPQHRLVMESHLGRLLRSDEDVHHKNDNRSDNRIENLELLTHREHMRRHCKQRHETGGFQKGRIA